MAKIKIAITGAAGFIGSNIAQALADQYEIIAVDFLDSEGKKKNLASFEHDQYFERDEFLDKLQKNEITDLEAIIHMGACTDTTETDQDYMMGNNLEYSKRLVEYCLKNNTRLIYASSAATYGDGSKGFDDKERDLKPLNLYGESKYLFDEWLLDSEKKPKQWVGLKFLNVYGPGEGHKGKMASMVTQCINQAKDRGEIRLFASSNPKYADGQEARDFIYVKDVVKVIKFLLDNPDKSGIFNVGTGKARSFKDVAKAVFKSLGKEEKITFFPMPEEIKDKYQYFTEADLTNLRAAGYEQDFYELEDGIEDYIARINANEHE